MEEDQSLQLQVHQVELQSAWLPMPLPEICLPVEFATQRRSELSQPVLLQDLSSGCLPSTSGKAALLTVPLHLLTSLLPILLRLLLTSKDLLERATQLYLHRLSLVLLVLEVEELLRS